jgi:hypothetical protein
LICKSFRISSCCAAHLTCSTTSFASSFNCSHI